MRIPTLADRVRILTLRGSILESSVHKVGIGEKVRIFIDRKVNAHLLSLKIYRQLSGRVHFEQDREG